MAENSLTDDRLKRCAGCGDTKYWSGYYLLGGKPRSHCKSCMAAGARKRADIKATARAEERGRLCKPGHRTCTGCHRELPLDSFGRVPSRNDQVLSRCKSCSYEALRLWRSTARGKQYQIDGSVHGCVG